MKKIFITILFLFALIGTVNAVTLSDNFSGYETYYKILNDTNFLATTQQTDGNAPLVGTQFDGNNAILEICDVSLNGSNACGVFSSNQPRGFIDITDFNALGKIKFNVGLQDANYTNLANLSYLEMRIGSAAGTYFEYRVSNLFVGGQGAVGKNTYSVDLNSPSATSGSPVLTDINFFSFRVVYTANTQDFNFILNKVWVEKTPNAFGGTWLFDTNTTNGRQMGGGMPFNYLTEGFGLSLFDTNRPGELNRSDLFATAFTKTDASTYDYDLSVDINQVESTTGSRILFDFVDKNNYSSGYIFRTSATQATMGIDQWVNAVKVSDSNFSIPFTQNQYDNFRITVTNKLVNLYQDGNNVKTLSITSRQNGKVGLESNNGRTHFDNVVFLSNQDRVTLANNHTCGSVTNGKFDYSLLGVMVAIIALIGAVDYFNKKEYSKMMIGIIIAILIMATMSLICI